MRAIIAGAGVGGLATALALSRAGFDATIYERTAALEEFGAGLQLTPNATRVLASLGALDEVREAAMAPDAVCALRGSDDATLMRLSLKDAERRWGAPYLALHRADLQQALAQVASAPRQDPRQSGIDRRESHNQRRRARPSNGRRAMRSQKTPPTS